MPLRDNKPYLGICLGAQMMARHLGGRVYPHPEGHAEVGYYPIRPTAAGRSICPTGPTRSINGTAKASTCRPAASCWPKATPFPVQAFRYGSGYALQFHPEVTHAMMYRWLVRGAHRMELPGTKQRHEHIADRAVYDLAARNWLAAFLHHWLALPAVKESVAV